MAHNPPASSAPATLSSPERVKPSSQPSPVKQLDLNSFAYQRRTAGRPGSYSASSRAAGSSTFKSSTESCSDASKPIVGSSIKAVKASSAPKTFYIDSTNGSTNADATFTAEEVSSLSSCVVCGNTWTARKLPKSKWAHITACAQKHGCGSDALQIKLAAAVVSAAEVKGRKTAKDKEKEQLGPRTLLAHTVRENAPHKRRGRRKDPGPSGLQSVEDTHGAILERGAALLGVAPVSDNGSQQEVMIETPVTKTSAEEQDEASMSDIPATQTFAPSKIAGRSRFFGEIDLFMLIFCLLNVWTGNTIATMNIDSRSGLFYADLPCTVFSSTSLSRAISTSEVSQKRPKYSNTSYHNSRRISATIMTFLHRYYSHAQCHPRNLWILP